MSGIILLPKYVFLLDCLFKFVVLRRAAVQHVRSSNQLRVAFIHNTKTPGIITKVRRILKSHWKLYPSVSDLNPDPEPDNLLNLDPYPDEHFYDIGKIF